VAQAESEVNMRIGIKALAIVGMLCVAACEHAPPSSAAQAQAPVAAGSDPVTRGKALVEAKCAGCHAVGDAGGSPVSPAPPFRTLAQRYPVANLQEAFAEGISTGHPKMPEIVLEGRQVRDLIAYLESIQTPAKAN
jgi:mono/diheme cytochrome c family protein